MMIGGRLYPLHLAISSRWKIHYFTADMSEHPEHRAEDAAFLADMAGVLGPSVMRRLEQVRDALALDYGGIDFAVDAKDRVVVFEANATMSILPPPPDEIWAYRRGPIERAGNATRAMLLPETLAAGTAEG
jgi:hypothetical protein